MSLSFSRNWFYEFEELVQFCCNAILSQDSAWLMDRDMTSWEEEVVLRDVTNAGIVVSDHIAREAASKLDLEEALEASRYASHPYAAHPREVILYVLAKSEFFDKPCTWFRKEL